MFAKKKVTTLFAALFICFSHNWLERSDMKSYKIKAIISLIDISSV